MLTIVRDRHYISFTLDPDVSVIPPAVHWFRDLASQWGVDNADRRSAELGEVMLNAVALREPRDVSAEMRCRVERTSGGHFMITVEEDAHGSRCGHTAALNTPERIRQCIGTGIRRVFRDARLKARDGRMTKVVAAPGTVADAQPTARGRVTIFERSTAAVSGRNGREGDGIHD